MPKHREANKNVFYLYILCVVVYSVAIFGIESTACVASAQGVPLYAFVPSIADCDIFKDEGDVGVVAVPGDCDIDDVICLFLN